MVAIKSHNSKKCKVISAVGLLATLCFFIPIIASGQVKWINVDESYAPLPVSMNVYKTTDSLDGKPFIAYYAKVKLKDKHLNFTTDTSKDRRLTPLQFYSKDHQPLLLVNCCFFSYETNRSLNVVIKDGQMLAFNSNTISMKGKDTFQYKHPFGSAIGIDKKRNADVAWLLTDSAADEVYASQITYQMPYDSTSSIDYAYLLSHYPIVPEIAPPAFPFRKWKMKTAVGGGPVLLQDGQVRISNEEELKFTGKAINDKHPRTCMGYTKDGYLVIMVIEGRFPGIAEGATLEQEARLMMVLGCTEALNLDGGGSSCMLINGKETIKPSEKGVERPVPAVFLIQK